jgi:hypothetical protein
VVRSQGGTATTMISERIRSISRDLAQGFSLSASSQSYKSSFRGFSAGSSDARWGVWGDASGAFLDTSTAVGYRGNSVVALSGIDYIPDNNWVIGFSAGYLHADIGLRAVPATRLANGGTFGPYASYIIDRNFTVDAQFEYARLSNDLTATAPVPSGTFGSNRLTGAANFNAFADYGGWKLTGYTGYAYTWEGANTTILAGVPPLANNVRYGAFKIGGEAAYPIDDLEPYIPLTYYYETTTPTDQTSRSALQVGGGLRYRSGDSLKAGLQVTAIEIKSHTKDVRIEANLRWTF